MELEFVLSTNFERKNKALPKLRACPRPVKAIKFNNKTGHPCV